jgi:hypothetical protein
MTKFWVGAATLLLLGIATLFLATGTTNSGVMIHDIETECRYDRDTRTQISLGQDNTLRFKGHFPENNPDADTEVKYKGGKNIVLKIDVEDTNKPESYMNDCLSAVVYDVETGALQPGMYTVEVKHDGERAEKRIIQVKE